MASIVSEIRQIEAIPLQEECRLYDAWKYLDDQNARQQLINAHLPWVLWIAKRYSRHAIIDELVDIGTVGLIQAVDAENYDPRHRRLTKCSYFQINDAIKRAVESQAHQIKLPQNRDYKCGESLEAKKTNARRTLSLDAGEQRLRDTIRGNDNPVAAVQNRELREVLHHCVDLLPYPLCVVIRQTYFGGMTFAEIDRRQGFSHGMSWKYHGRGLAALAKNPIVVCLWAAWS